MDFQNDHFLALLLCCTNYSSWDFPCRYLIQKVLYSIPTLLVGIPPSATDKGQPELINEGRMLAEEKENVQFIFADGENWKRKSVEVWKCVRVCMLRVHRGLLLHMFNIGKEIVSNTVTVAETVNNCLQSILAK